MKLNHTQELLSDYIDGTLPPGPQSSVQHHLLSCAECRAEERALRNVIEDVRRLPKTMKAPPELLKGIDMMLSQTEIATLNILHQRNGDSKEAGAIHLNHSVSGKSLLFSFFSSRSFRAAAIVVVLIGAATLWFSLSHTTRERMTQTPSQVTATESPFDFQNKQPVTSTDSGETQEPANQTFALKKAENNKNNQHQQNSSKESSGISSAILNNNEDKNNPEHEANMSIYASNTGKITGRVVDDKGMPVVGANVLVLGTTRGAATDYDGQYTIIGVPVGTYTLHLDYLNNKDSASAIVYPDSTTQLNFSVKILPYETKGVYITSERVIVNTELAGSSAAVAEKKIEQMPNTNSVNNIVQLQTGIVRQGNNVHLRGGRANNSQYVVEGISQNREGYSTIVENEFLDALSNPLSTFSIDVDAASYSNVRRFINDGQLPPKDAVRIEEMINYFTYDYPQPKNHYPFSITTEVSECDWNNEHKLLLIGLQGKNIDMEDLPASNLVFLLDVSGSMDEENKLPLVKQAFRLLVDRLREQDRVSIVTYAGNAGLVLPSTSGENKKKILNAIENLRADGSTAGGEGIQLAYSVAKENFLKNGNNRVILATDGDFNVGISSDAELVSMIEEKRKDGIYLSVLGFGEGNYQDAKMQQLADKGNGNHFYIDNLNEAKKVFVGQMAGTLFTIAKDVKLQIEFNPAKIKAYRLIGYENRLLAKEDFNDDKKDAGELGAGHTVTALYEIVFNDGSVKLSNVDSLKYQNHATANDTYANELLTVKLRYKEPNDTISKLIVNILNDESRDIEDASENLRFASSVAEFGLLLRDSKFKGSASFEKTLRLANDAKGKDREGYRSEFIKMVEEAKKLME